MNEIFSRPSATMPRRTFTCALQTWKSRPGALAHRADSASAGGAELLYLELELMFITHFDEQQGQTQRTRSVLSPSTLQVSNPGEFWSISRCTSGILRSSLWRRSPGSSIFKAPRGRWWPCAGKVEDLGSQGLRKENSHLAEGRCFENNSSYLVPTKPAENSGLEFIIYVENGLCEANCRAFRRRLRADSAHYWGFSLKSQRMDRQEAALENPAQLILQLMLKSEPLTDSRPSYQHPSPWF